MTVTYQAKTPIWCSGCGHFGVGATLLQALIKQQVEPSEVMVLAGIGCSGTIQNNMQAYGYHALHGRVLPTATGMAVANPELTVIAAGGDGDGYAIGLGHLIHTFRRNPNILYVVMNNATYGLTKGQPSPTAEAIEREQEHPVDAIQLGLTVPATSFLARGYVGHSVQLDQIMNAALSHVRNGKGFAFVEVISPCVTYNDTFDEWGERLIDVMGLDNYQADDRVAVINQTTQIIAEGRLPTGIILQREAETYEQILGVTAQSAPAYQSVALTENIKDYRELLTPYIV